jgi:hypothetical protein
MTRLYDIAKDNYSQNIIKPRIIHEVTIQIVINNMNYNLQSRNFEDSRGEVRYQYRILFKKIIIKDWAEGNIEKYFI